MLLSDEEISRIDKSITTGHPILKSKRVVPECQLTPPHHFVPYAEQRDQVRCASSITPYHMLAPSFQRNILLNKDVPISFSMVHLAKQKRDCLVLHHDR